MLVSTLERLRAAITDPTRLAPVARTVGVRVTDVEPGRIVAGLPATEVLPPLGAALVLADFLLGSVVGTGLAPGQRVSTLSLHASVFATGAGPLTATGWLVRLDTTGVSHALVCDADGAPVASTSSRCAVLPTAAPPPPAEPADITLDLRSTADGVRATADPALANYGSTVQGGVLATVLAHALDAAAPGVELDVTYLRAVPADGAEVTARATPLHEGRRFAARRAELFDARGRSAAIATASRWLPPADPRIRR